MQTLAFNRASAFASVSPLMTHAPHLISERASLLHRHVARLALFQKPQNAPRGAHCPAQLLNQLSHVNPPSCVPYGIQPYAISYNHVCGQTFCGAYLAWGALHDTHYACQACARHGLGCAVV